MARPSIEWFGGDFGWTTTKAVADWFEKEFENYERHNALKLKAFRSLECKNSIREQLAKTRRAKLDKQKDAD